ncbi:MAG: PTS fructose transporter subunit IIA [Pseudomonadota bacterium]
MTAILLVSHQRVGLALREALESILQTPCGEPKPVVEVLEDDRCHPDAFLHRLQNEIERLLLDGQLLILTDLPGATPHNLAVQAAAGRGVPVVSGINLPMLLRCVNHIDLPAEVLAEKAVEGARAAIFQDATKDGQNVA